MATVNLGNVALKQSDYGVARSLYEESLAIFRESGDRRGIAMAIGNLGLVANNQGDYAMARSLHEECLIINRELGDRASIADSLEGMASVSVNTSEEHKAVVLWGAARLLRESLGSPLPPDEQAEQDQYLEQARSILGEPAFSAAWAEGRGMLWEQAVSYALDESDKAA